jgi:hypothetical protein
VLRAAARRSGFELLLLDAPPALLEQLRSAGELEVAGPPSLEDLFLQLTGPDQPGLLREGMDALAGAGALAGSTARGGSR